MLQPDCKFTDYLADPAISASGLNLIRRSPAHYLADKLSPKKPTEALLFGQMFHCLLMTPDLFAKEFGILPKCDKRTKEGKALYAEWLEDNADKAEVKEDDLTDAEGMRNAILAHPEASVIFSEGHPECSIFWENSALGPVMCKSRPDWRTEDGWIIDLKTTTDARESPFSKDCYNFGYHRKAAFYVDAFKAEFKCEPQGFLFVAVEKERPYGVRVYHANESMIEQGRREYHQDLAVYAECLKTNTWPCYPTGVSSLLLPTWAQTNEE